MNPRPAFSRIFILLILTLTLSHAAGADSKTDIAGWRERSAGLFVSRPEVRLSGNGGRITGETELKPGSAIGYEIAVDSPGTTMLVIDLAIQADGCNLKSLDYDPDDSHFLFSETVVFGRDKQDIGWGKRALRFLGRLWDGFPPEGIRLTYAWGCGAPVGSMFRLTEEETVFVVAGKEEAGKRIESKRTAAADFLAAYGRQPKGPVTSLFIRLDRPSNEKGNVKLSFDVKPMPGP